jgi:DNA repair protein RecN (Recombination protein N)
VTGPRDGHRSIRARWYTGRVLRELRVENLLLIERAELRLEPGLNVLTGETGAGKTVLAHALDLLLGGRARAGIVRPGAAEAYVEGTFDLPEGLRGALEALIAPDAEELVLARRVSAEGRTRAALNGRACSVADLRDVAAGLIVFYGQHEHRRLTLASAQLQLLDAACGPAQAERRAAFAAELARARALEASLDELRERAGARDRELDLLEFEIAEIEQADPTEDEEDGLAARRARLRHVEALRAAALGGAEALASDEAGVGALLAAGGAGLEGVEGVDPALDGLVERWRAVAIEAQDLAGELRGYGEGLEAQPGELEVVEERLAVLDRLKRKHGGTVALVLEHAAACRARRDELAGAEVALERATAELAAARDGLERRAQELRAARVEAAPGLAAAVRERLAHLAMEAAEFEIAVEPRDEPVATGADHVEFRIAANPGVPAGALRDIASGGELSRVMLALMGVASDGSQATLVFDEVDAGIGGVTARAVGEQLRDLAAGRQVVCITHLPQIASLAARHFSIAKDVDREPARTTVRTLAGAEVVSELVRMLGAGDDDVAARRHAKELLKAA